jgi:hypothetical protein
MRFLLDGASIRGRAHGRHRSSHISEASHRACPARSVHSQWEGSMNYPLAIVQKLAEERREREGREHGWDLVNSVLGHLKDADILLESNPLYLGSGATSYLEQVQIHLPEAQPGYGETMREALVMLFDLLQHRPRDMLTDEERVAIGWKEL